MIRFISSWALICLFFASSGLAFAHQQKAAVTQVLLNERSGYLEVAHRFYIHDAEHAVKLITGSKEDIFKSRETQIAFYEYVTSHFDLFIEQQAIELNSIGFEIEGAFFWAYQEIAFEGNLKSVGLQHSSLQEFWPNQINTVNVESGDQLRTAIFDKSGESVYLDFQQP